MGAAPSLVSSGMASPCVCPARWQQESTEEAERLGGCELLCLATKRSQNSGKLRLAWEGEGGLRAGWGGEYTHSICMRDSLGGIL